MKTKFLLIMTGILLFSISSDAQGTWTRKADFPGVTRHGVVAFTQETSVYVGTGGHLPSGIPYGLQDFWKWNQSTDTWTQVASLPAAARTHSTCFTIGSMGYLVGGTNGYNMMDMWEYNTVANSWTQKASFPGGWRGGQGPMGKTGNIGTKGYYGLGSNYTGTMRYNDFWEWDQATNTWTRKADYPGSGRAYMVSFAIGTKFYMGCGLNDICFNDFWEWNQATNTWTQKANFPGGVRCSAASFAIGDKGYVGAGISSDNVAYNDFYEYDPATDTWVRLADYPGSGRGLCAGFSIGSKAYIGLGYIYDGTQYNDFWEFDPTPIPPLEVTTTQVDVLCYGENTGSATVIATGGVPPYTCLWDDPDAQTGATASNLGAGAYTVVVTDSQGSSVSATVTIIQPDPLYVSAGANQVVYYGYPPAGCTTLTASGATGGLPPYLYSWSTGETTQSISVCPATATVYTVTVTDANNCSFSDEVKVCVFDIRCGNGSNFGKKVKVCHYTPGNPGKYQTLCIDTSAVAAHLAHGDLLEACDLNRECTDLKSGIAENNNPEQSGEGIMLETYPNPFSNLVTIIFRCPEEGIVTIRLIDYTGREAARMYQRTVEKEDRYQFNFDGSSLSRGMYFCTLQHSNGTLKTLKLILSK